MTETPDHASRGHHPHSPSSLKYKHACAGYTSREGSSAAAEKGTRIHEALEVRDPSALHDEEEVSIYEEIVKEEAAFLDSFTKGSYTEQNEVMLDVELDGTSTYGTCDRLILVGEDQAILADYKTGISVIDEPRDNWQAKAYTVGAFQRYPHLQTIQFVFYVPVRNQTLTGEFKREELPQLIEELSNVIKRAEEVAPKWEDGAPPLSDLSPNVNCRFCAYEDKCPALGGLAIEVASRVAEGSVPDGDIENPEDPETMEKLWMVAKIVSNWASRIKSKAVEMAKDGVEYPSLRLRSMGRTRKCNDNAKLLEIASQIIDTDNTEELNKEILELANLPLRKVADTVGSYAEKGEKGQKANDFLDALEKADIVSTSEERHTLS